MDFIVTLLNVAVLVALALPGFILQKLKKLPERTVPVLVFFVVYVSQPFLTISSFLKKDYEPSLLAGMGLMLVLSVFFEFLIYFLAKLIFKPIANRKTRSACVIVSFMGNVGFMGIPVMEALFPNNPEFLLYTAVFIIGFNIVGWTAGIYEVTGDKKSISLKNAFLNPAVAALVVALPLFFFKSYIPEIVMTPISSFVEFFADMTLPLSMVVVGVRLAEMSFKDLIGDPKVYFASAVRLVVAPLLVLVLSLLLHLIVPFDKNLIYCLYIIMAMPAAAMTLNFAEMFGGDRETAVKINVLSTLLCAVTIPLLMLMIGVV